MNKYLIALTFVFTVFLFAGNTYAAHCSGGHKEIKETSETSEENITSLSSSLLPSGTLLSGVFGISYKISLISFSVFLRLSAISLLFSFNS